MFRNVRSSARDPLLPTSSNGRRSGGGSIHGGMRSSRPDISKSFIATVIWALVSVGLIAWGWLYCARRMEMSTFSCNHFLCKFEQTKGGVTELIQIPRSKLVRGEMVRVKKGEIVRDYGKLKRSEQRKLGYSYAIVYMDEDSEDDDDESYDSYEDDDDSYDSYDDGGDERTIIPPQKKTPPQKMSLEAKEAIARKRAEKEKYTRQRDKERGLPPIKEPDEPPRRVSRDNDGDGRFPGDAGIIEEIEVEKLPSQESMMRQANAEMEARGWKNHRQERMAKSTSPDDLDNIKPPQKKVEDAAAAEMEKKEGSDRHHVHHGFHHRPGDKKVEGGWRHQNRQWHKHEELKQLGTSYDLKRWGARKRKETIDNYVRKNIHKLEFTDSIRWRVEGVFMMYVGFMSTAFCMLNGNFQPRYAIILSLLVNAAVVIVIA